MSEVILSDYFYGDESEQFIYFRIPRLLITSPRFKHLSTDPIPTKAQEETPKKAPPRAPQEKSLKERGTGSTPSPTEGAEQQRKPSVKKRLERLKAMSEQTRTGPEKVRERTR